MKTILPIVIVAALIVGGIFWYYSANQSELPDGGRIASSTAQASDGKLKVANFSGKLEKVDTGCFADGECYVMVDGKHVTTLRGWSRDTVGSIQGVDSIGDLEDHIGETVDVYAKDNGDGTYTLYGSEGFYVKVK